MGSRLSIVSLLGALRISLQSDLRLRADYTPCGLCWGLTAQTKGKQVQTKSALVVSPAAAKDVAIKKAGALWRSGRGKSAWFTPK